MKAMRKARQEPSRDWLGDWRSPQSPCSVSERAAEREGLRRLDANLSPSSRVSKLHYNLDPTARLGNRDRRRGPGDRAPGVLDRLGRRGQPLLARTARLG
jgi:hypothetical protein